MFAWLLQTIRNFPIWVRLGLVVADAAAAGVMIVYALLVGFRLWNVVALICILAILAVLAVA
jgi:hypothetical protein